MESLLSPSRALATFLILLSLAFGSFSAPQQGAGCAPGEKGPPVDQVNYFALVIGNNNYAPSVGKLTTPVADACEVERVLRESYGFRTRLLFNATRAQIVAALAAYRRELGPEASLLIYYAGHGYTDKDAGKAYWIPVDATLSDTANWIIADEITTDIRVIPARHVLVISDSCYSGVLARGLGPGVGANLQSERERFLQKMAAGHSRQLMASGGDEPVADGGGGGHSVFAAALLRGLRQMDKPRFTGAELFAAYVIESVAGQAKQTPLYDPLRDSGHQSGDFVFAKVKTGANAAEVTANTAVRVEPSAIEMSFWETIKNSTDPEDFKAYLEKFPSGIYTPLAKNSLRRLMVASNGAAEPSPNPPLNDTHPAAPSPQVRPKTLSIPDPPLHDADAFFNRGVSHSEKQEYDRAIADFTDAIRLESKSAAAYYNRGNCYHAEGDYDRAIADYTEAIRLDPKLAEAYTNRGVSYHAKREYDLSIADFTKAIKLNPQLAMAYADRGGAYNEKREYDRAYADLTKAMALDPTLPEAYVNRGNFYIAKQEYDRAIADFTRAIELDPKRVQPYNNRGVIYNVKQEYDLAIADFTEEIRLDPKLVQPYFQRGMGYSAKREYDHAITDFTRAIELAPDLYQIYYSRMWPNLYLGKGEATYQDAADYLKRKDKMDAESIYAIIAGYFGLRKAHKESQAKAFLDEWFSRADATIWPYAALRYLRQEITEDTLLSLAVDNDKMTEAKTYMGEKMLLDGHREPALEHFRWVIKNGNRDFVEYILSDYEIRRLDAESLNTP